jgi:hypothetical protein
MHAILASMILLAIQQAPQQSLLREVVPNPTGRNGYEEYLMACDVVRNTRVALILTSPAQLRAVAADYERPRSREEELNDKTAKPNEEYYSAAKRYQNLTQLQLRREAVRIAGAALELVAKGNRKQVFDPRIEKSWETTFPELAEMRTVARLATAAAYLAYADGQPGKGNQYLIDALEMGHQISRGVLIARLVGIAVHATVLAAYEKLLPLMTASDAGKIIVSVPRWVSNPPAAVATLEAEFAFMQRNVAKMFDRIEDAQGLLFSEEKKSIAENTASDLLTRMSLADKQRVIQICQEHFAKQRDRLLASYRRPESEWDLPVDLDDDPYPETKAVRTAEDFGQYVASMITPAFTQIGSAEIRNRSQLRVLQMAAAVVRYKWEHDKLPATLAEAVGEESLTDPVSGDKFQYEVQGSGFKVWSKGTPRTGEIGLRYVRPQQGQDGPPPPIP